MAVAVHGQAEGSDVLLPGLQQRHARVLDRVLLLHALAAVAAVLRAAVADQEHELRPGVDLFELRRGVADGGAHARGVERRDLVEAALDLVVERLLDLLDDVELDVLAAEAGEAVDAVAVAEGFERRHEQHHRLLLHVDDALVRASRGLAAAGAEPGRVGDGVGRDVPVGVPRALLDGLGGRRAHIDEEDDADVALVLVAAPVDALVRRAVAAELHEGLDPRVDVDVLALGEPLHLAVHLGANGLELAADLVHEPRVGVQGLGVEIGLAGNCGALLDDAPAGPVIIGAEVPLVVDEAAGLERLERPALLVLVRELVVARGPVVGGIAPRLLEHVGGDRGDLRVVAYLHLGGVAEHLLDLLHR